MSKKDNKKLYIVRKYVMATDCSQAIRLEKKMKPDDVYVSDDWKEGKNRQLASAIGFVAYNENEEMN